MKCLWLFLVSVFWMKFNIMYSRLMIISMIVLIRVGKCWICLVWKKLNIIELVSMNLIILISKFNLLKKGNGLYFLINLNIVERILKLLLNVFSLLIDLFGWSWYCIGNLYNWILLLRLWIVILVLILKFLDKIG